MEEDFYFNDGVKYTIKPEELERIAGQTREQQCLAEAAYLREAVRVAALTKAAEQKMSREQARELALKEEKAAWDLIRASTNADDFYAFLQRFPSGGELAEMAQYRLDQLAKPKIMAALGQGQDASLGYTGARLKVGDTFEVQVSDILTKVPGEGTINRVTSIEGDTAVFNNGRLIFTLLGAIIKHDRGSYDPPFRGTPVEFQVGKKVERKLDPNEVLRQDPSISTANENRRARDHHSAGGYFSNLCD